MGTETVAAAVATPVASPPSSGTTGAVTQTGALASAVQPPATASAPAAAVAAEAPATSMLGDLANPPAKVEEVKADAKDKKGEAAKKEEKFEYKLPEGSLLPKSHTEKIAAFAAARGLSNEQAQASLEFVSASVTEYRDGLEKSFEDRKGLWKTELTNHPTLGGEKLKETDAYVTAAVRKFGPPSFEAELRESGFIFKTSVAEFFRNVGKAMASDRIVAPGAKPPAKTESVEYKLYPSMRQAQA